MFSRPLRRTGSAVVIIASAYAAAMAVLIVYGANLFWLALVHAHGDRRRVRQGEAPALRTWPLVTVQVPLYNEALVVERVIDACARIDYPALQIQILDDSTDETCSIARNRVAYWEARGKDIDHICRSHRDGYKAGALAHGCGRAKGSLVAVFDADFVPPPDFLTRIVPHFDDQGIGMVQARWTHLNADDSVLTRLQAFGLDAHFAVEQSSRQNAGCFINFNGTAGVWRRQCIEDAGGWQGDTLAEDLDLSFRAQLRGWRFRYLGEVEAPAELPRSLPSLRSQQFRWTKGAAETAIKLLRPLWHSHCSARIKIEGAFHLTGYLAYPALIVAVLSHTPLLMLEHAGRGPGPAYFAFCSVGLVGFLGFFLAQAQAQRTLYPSWHTRLLFFPVYMAGSMGLALSNCIALWQAILRRRTAFVRTPKFSGDTWWKSRYARTRVPMIAYLEFILAVYSVAGLAVLMAQRDWAACIFQACFAGAFLITFCYNIRHAWLNTSAHPGSRP